ncbi:tRNA pseudouridine(38-40) synthase TruA [Pelagibaculum spongiae]|uniref:tRNA pseudouridine synthase A n=1 Tax=Pelagibaculum spongiae TaxID=2080658 RepID=A0A2V1GWY5_9GAMM|nr:tRNA pseudouridine(38-40) synthase TruA [Pelagibaculum spongiae]PVZ71691.1 tRNA pseudouridine(38-40) synthase TruA [Pelagibaculum spongiae]
MKFAAGVEYDGQAFKGWQRQKDDVHTVQLFVERSLSKIANHPVTVHCAGRTDAGVHATGQVVHFETDAVRDERAWTFGGNTNLPDGVSFKWVKPVSDDFHARFSATARRYRYVIANTPLRPALFGKHLSWNRRPLDEKLMHLAAQSMLGERDFSSFRAHGCQSNTPWRFMRHIHVFRQAEYVIIDIKANAFLYHMVRNIAGALMEVGAGLKPVAWTAELMEAKDRSQAGITAPPNGLFLVEVDYPEQFNLPKHAIGPLFLESGLPPC